MKNLSLFRFVTLGKIERSKRLRIFIVSSSASNPSGVRETKVLLFVRSSSGVGVDDEACKSARRYFHRLAKVWRALRFIAIAYGYALRRDEAKMWTKWRGEGKGRKEERSSPISTTALSYGAIVATCRRSCSTNFSMSIYIFRGRPFMSC